MWKPWEKGKIQKVLIELEKEAREARAQTPEEEREKRDAKLNKMFRECLSAPGKKT